MTGHGWFAESFGGNATLNQPPTVRMRFQSSVQCKPCRSRSLAATQHGFSSLPSLRCEASSLRGLGWYSDSVCVSGSGSEIRLRGANREQHERSEQLNAEIHFIKLQSAGFAFRHTSHSFASISHTKHYMNMNVCLKKKKGKQILSQTINNNYGHIYRVSVLKCVMTSFITILIFFYCQITKVQPKSPGAHLKSD